MPKLILFLIGSVGIFLTLVAILKWFFPGKGNELGTPEKLFIFVLFTFLFLFIVYVREIGKYGIRTYISLRDKQNFCETKIMEIDPMLGLDKRVKHVYAVLISNTAPLNSNFTDFELNWVLQGEKVEQIICTNPLTGEKLIECASNENRTANIKKKLFYSNTSTWAIIETLQTQEKQYGRDEFQSSSNIDYSVSFKILGKEFKIEKKQISDLKRDGMWITRPDNLIDFATTISKNIFPEKNFAGHLPTICDEKKGNLRLKVYIYYKGFIIKITNKNMIYEFESPPPTNDFMPIRIVVSDNADSPRGTSIERTFVNASFPLTLNYIEDFFNPNPPNRNNEKEYLLPVRIENFYEMVEWELNVEF